MKKDTVHFMVNCDKNYIKYSINLIKMIMSKADLNRPYCGHFYYYGMEEAFLLKRLYSLTKMYKNLRLIPYKIDLPLTNFQKKYGKAAYGRIGIEIPDISKLLYLDVDMMVVEDIAKLYDTDISDYSCAAVQDPIITKFINEKLSFLLTDDFAKYDWNSYCHKVLEVEGEKIFNGGVILFNMEKYRTHFASKKMIDFVNKYNPSLADQDALNSVMQKIGPVKWLDKKWNINLSLLDPGNVLHVSYNVSDIAILHGHYWNDEYKNLVPQHIQEFFEEKALYPKISVLMPVYKTNLIYLKRCVDSILNQTYGDFEFLILDDCPEDKSVECFIKENYNDDRIKYSRNEKNLGISGARNRLLNLATGEYFAIMDHDDLSLPTRFEKQIDFLEKNSDYGVCGCQHGFIGRENISKRPVTNNEIQKMLKTSLSCPLHHPSTMLRACVIRKNNIQYNDAFSPAEDYYLWLALSKITKMHNLNEVLFMYLDEDNTTSKKQFEIIRRCQAAQMAFNCKLMKVHLKKKSKIFNITKEAHKDKIVYSVTLLGMKFNLKRKLSKKTRLLQAFLSSIEVPFVRDEKFYYYRDLPAFSKDFGLYSDIFETPKVGIVLQGPLNNQNNFTYETILFYQKTFSAHSNNVELIVSTWDDENKDVLENLKSLGCTVVTQAKPSPGISNINLQIQSTKLGLIKAKELGCEYVIKTRTDQRFYSANILEFLFNTMKLFPLDSDVKALKNRLIALSFNTFKYRRYGVSDMFLFGHIEDVIKYWDVNSKDYKPALEGKNSFEIFKNECPETFVCENFIKKIAKETSNDLADTHYAYYKYFCFIDKENIDMYWPKYSNANSRFERFYKEALEEVKFKDWLNLYYRKGINKEWQNDCFLEIPKI